MSLTLCNWATDTTQDLTHNIKQRISKTYTGKVGQINVNNISGSSPLKWTGEMLPCTLEFNQKQ